MRSQQPIEACPPGYVAVLPHVHTDEYTSKPAYDIHELLQRQPIEGVWSVPANERTLLRNRATGGNERFTEIDLQLAVDGSHASSSAYEIQRRKQLMVATQAARIIIQPHANGELIDYAWYDAAVCPEVRGLVTSVGMTRAVIVGPMLMSYGDPRHVMLDFGRPSQATYLDTMYGLLERLVVGQYGEPGAVREYNFEADVKVEDVEQAGLPMEHEAWQPFEGSDQQKLISLGLSPDCVPTSWSYQRYGKRYGFIGEMVRPVTVV
jgi:hypothetical protein